MNKAELRDMQQTLKKLKRVMRDMYRELKEIEADLTGMVEK